MEMKNRLTGGFPNVDSDIVSIRLEAPRDGKPCNFHGASQRHTLLMGGFEPISNVPSGNQ
jgi:hypothetical protein